MSDQQFQPGFCQPKSLDILSDTENYSSILKLDFPPDPNLIAQGWERRFMSDSDRIREATDLYTELGFEVRTESILPVELNAICGDCRLATCRSYMTLYIRKRK